MQRQPFAHHRQRPARQRTGIDGPIQCYQGFVLGLDGLEVHRRMLAPVHVDHDAEKARDLGHYAAPRSGITSAPAFNVSR